MRCCRRWRSSPRSAHSAAIVPVSAETAVLDALALRKSREAAAGRRRRCSTPTITDRDERFLASEFVREKIFRLLGEEVPYATTVVDRGLRARRRSAPDPARRSTSIATTSARSCSAPAAVQMKAIAASARATWSGCSAGTVFLEVWVRVKRGWADERSAR